MYKNSNNKQRLNMQTDYVFNNKNNIKSNRSDTYPGTKNNLRDNFRENYQEKYKETNRELIKYIYSTLDISQFKFDILKYEQQLSKFIGGTYFISPNYYGKNCFLVFMKLKTKYFSFMIDRRQLSYTLDKVKLDDVFVHHCNVDVDLEVYSGTILDGVYMRRGNIHEFVVTDVYLFKGADYTQNKLNHKLFELEMYLDNINSQTRFIKERINAKINLELKVNKIRKLTDINTFLENDIKDYEKKYQIRGICFYPEISGIKLIYLHENENMDNKNKLNDQILDNHMNFTNKSNSKKFSKHDKTDTIDEDSVDSGNKRVVFQKSKSLVKRVFVAKTNDPVYAVLEMQATKTADNYKLFALEQIKDVDKVRFKKCQMDIAYIPNMKKSQWCRDITTASSNGRVFVNCIWRDDKRKWEPLELKFDVKLPSLIDDIRKNIVEMEGLDSDSEDA